MRFPPLPRALPSLLSTLIGVAAVVPGTAAQEPDHAAARTAMVRMVRVHADTVDGIAAPVLAALARVPRHRFVPVEMAHFAYDDRPLPIGDGQTISQPFIVAYMTELLGVGPGAKVLEVGTGSGYQAAVLLELGCEVYSIEIVRALGERTAALLDTLGYRAALRIGDGYLGWPEAAPFDAIMVTAGATEIPAPLLAQLKPGARLVLPLADAAGTEWLTVVSRGPDGQARLEQKIPVLFVPLTRGNPR